MNYCFFAFFLHLQDRHFDMWFGHIVCCCGAAAGIVVAKGGSFKVAVELFLQTALNSITLVASVAD